MYPIISISGDKGRNYKSLSRTFFPSILRHFMGCSGRTPLRFSEACAGAERAREAALRAAGLLNPGGPVGHQRTSSRGRTSFIRSQLWLRLTLTQQPNSDSDLILFFF